MRVVQLFAQTSIALTYSKPVNVQPSAVYRTIRPSRPISKPSFYLVPIPCPGIHTPALHFNEGNLRQQQAHRNSKRQILKVLAPVLTRKLWQYVGRMSHVNLVQDLACHESLYSLVDSGVPACLLGISEPMDSI